MEAPSSAGVKGSSTPPDELELLDELLEDELELDDELLDEVELLLLEAELLDVELEEEELLPPSGTRTLNDHK